MVITDQARRGLLRRLLCCSSRMTNDAANHQAIPENDPIVGISFKSDLAAPYHDHSPSRNASVSTRCQTGIRSQQRQSEDSCQISGGLTQTAIDCGRLAPQGVSVWPDLNTDRPACLSLDLSAARDRLAVRHSLGQRLHRGIQQQAPVGMPKRALVHEPCGRARKTGRLA